MYCNNLNKATTKFVPKNVLSRTILTWFSGGMISKFIMDERIELKKVHAIWLEEVNNTKNVYENCISTGIYPISYLNGYINLKTNLKIYKSYEELKCIWYILNC